MGVALHLRRDPLRVLLEAADRFGEVVALGPNGVLLSPPYGYVAVQQTNPQGAA